MTATGSKGSLAHAEQAHFLVMGQIHTLRLQLSEHLSNFNIPVGRWCVSWLVRHTGFELTYVTLVMMA